MKFTESQLEQAFISLLEAQGYPYVPGEEILKKNNESYLKFKGQEGVGLKNQVFMLSDTLIFQRIVSCLYDHTN